MKLTQSEIDALLNASREADEGPTQLVRRIEAEVQERCAKVCEYVSDEYQHREGAKYPELRTDAEAGASKCAAAIRRA